jgi:hypothetical protein
MNSRKENGIWVVRQSLGVSREDLEGTAENIKLCIDLVVERARKMGMIGEGMFDIRASKDYYNFDYTIGIEYVFDREENDREKRKREMAEAKLKEKEAAKRKSAAEKRKMKADAEYAEYLRLKEKFKEV